jgi:sucrose phosphorylase
MMPETFSFIASLTEQARALDMEVLVEVHSYFKQQGEIARQVDWVYDFALPPLVLHALFEADAQPLYEWMKIRPHNAITVLDTHDGIGVIDVGADQQGNPGLLAPEAIHDLVEEIHRRSRNQSKQATGAAANNLDLYQVNCTYLDALGGDETLYLIARAIQFFVPGIPQVYYVGLLGAHNDMELLARSGVGRDINRHSFTPEEITASLNSAFVKRIIALIRLRNSHPAFNGDCTVESTSRDRIAICWRHHEHWISLAVDLSKPSATLEHSTALDGSETIVIA